MHDRTIMEEESIPLLSSEIQTAEDDTETGSRFLPPNKDYHVFISHSSMDEEFVKALHFHLEKNLKFRCMIADYDFIPGQPIVDNISNSFKRCEKSLFVVSKSFLDSGYCGKEVDLAFTYAMDNRQKDYVIILKLDDSEFDIKLRDRTYINGTDLDIESIGRKFEMAFTGYVESAAAAQRPSNGKVVLQIYPVAMSSGLCGGMEYVFPDLSEDDMEKLRGSHIEDAATCYNIIKAEINETRLLRQYAWIYMYEPKKGCFVTYGIRLGTLTFMLSILFFIQWANKSPVDWMLNGIISLPLGLCLCSIAVKVWRKSIQKKILKGLKCVAIANQKLGNVNHIVLPKMKRATPLTYLSIKELSAEAAVHMEFIYYDITACRNYLQHHTTWSDTSPEYITERCDVLFKQIIMQRYHHNKKLLITNDPRHLTMESECCFCQSLEENVNIFEKKRAEKEKAQNVNEETSVMKVVGMDLFETTLSVEENNTIIDA